MATLRSRRPRNSPTPWAGRGGPRAERLERPTSSAPTPFVVRLPDRTERFTCCAIDALGVAPMLGQRVHIRARCHDCNTPLGFSAGPDAPGPEADGVMVWIEKMAGRGERRIREHQEQEPLWARRSSWRAASSVDS